jgi:hypothetical protein
MEIGLEQDALVEPVADGGQPQRTADIEGQIADLVTEAEQRLHR